MRAPRSRGTIPREASMRSRPQRTARPRKTSCTRDGMPWAAQSWSARAGGPGLYVRRNRVATLFRTLHTSPNDGRLPRIFAAFVAASQKSPGHCDPSNGTLPRDDKSLQQLLKLCGCDDSTKNGHFKKKRKCEVSLLPQDAGTRSSDVPSLLSRR